MPIYEYECKPCGVRFSKLVMSVSGAPDVVCPGCGGKKVERLISRVRYHRSEADRLEEFDTSKPRDESFYKDSRNVGLWAKKRAKEIGADLGPQFDEVVDKARSGELTDL
jgi:putative FmdB family regulatory protein